MLNSKGARADMELFSLLLLHIARPEDSQEEKCDMTCDMPPGSNGLWKKMSLSNMWTFYIKCLLNVIILYSVF